MSNLLHVCIFNAEPESSEALQSAVGDLNFVRVVAEVSSAEDLAQVLASTTVNLVFYHLDPDMGSVVPVIEQVTARYPDIAAIAISHQSDPQAIIGPMRAGCDQFVCEPIDPDDLASAVARVATKRLSSDMKSQTICVVAPSGGSGATTIACNLALEIAELTERECALVDLDLQFGDAGGNFDVEPTYCLADLAADADSMDETVIQQTAEHLPCGVALLARPTQLDRADAVTPDVVRRAYEVLSEIYENVVVDVPGHFDEVTLAILERADKIVVACQLVVPSIRNAHRFTETLKRLGVPMDRIEFVVNRSDGRSGRITINDLEDAVKKPVFGCVPNDYQFVARSIDIGKPIASLDRNSPVRAALRKIAQRLVAEPNADGARKGKGFLKRLLSK